MFSVLAASPPPLSFLSPDLCLPLTLRPPPPTGGLPGQPQGTPHPSLLRRSFSHLSSGSELSGKLLNSVPQEVLTWSPSRVLFLLLHFRGVQKAFFLLSPCPSLLLLFVVSDEPYFWLSFFEIASNILISGGGVVPGEDQSQVR